jgi:hypothetical protein
MKRSRTRRPLRSATIWVAVALALILAGCAHDGAVTPAKTGATQQQNPANPRYYGGPKYPMYPG